MDIMDCCNHHMATTMVGTAAAAKKARKKAEPKEPKEPKAPEARRQDAVDITMRQTTGNSVTPTLGGIESQNEIEKVLAGAKTSIQCELYRLGYDKSVDLLCAQAKAGVKVQVLLDPSPGYDPKDEAARNAMEERMKASGVELLMYPIESKDKIDHVKLLVVDGKTAVIGGLNWDPHSRFNLDLNVTIEGPAVADLNAVFANDWKISGGGDTPMVPKSGKGAPEAKGDAAVRVATTDVGREDIRTVVMENIDKAKKSIRMLSFALADKQVIEGLINAKKRGVDVKVMLEPGKPMSWVNLKAEKQLKEAGIETRWLKVDLENEEKLHAKVAMFDDDTAIVGSANFTYKGLTVNHEASVEVISKSVGPAMTNFFDNLWDNRSLAKCPDLPDFQEVASDEPYGVGVAHDLFTWYNGNYHPDEKHNWVGKRKTAILDAYKDALEAKIEPRYSADMDEAEHMGSLAAFLERRNVFDINPAPLSYERVFKKRLAVAKAAETTVPQNVPRYKQEMIDMVQDPQLKALLTDILEQAPEGFYSSPSSSTGKYHPADETRYVDVVPRHERPTPDETAKYPGGGLVLHSRRNMEMAAHLCDYYGIDGKNRDEILMGLSLHDVCKFVSMDAINQWQPGQKLEWGQWTTREHAHVGAEFVRKLDPSGGKVSEGVRKYIDMHMAAWNWPEPTPPKDPAEMVISLADYIASQANYYVKV
ncbi:MAG: HD domain-containing protein [Armatimonadetes bacterium]|nr:HD domain-containing protein [Armatimonadota bacterium]